MLKNFDFNLTDLDGGEVSVQNNPLLTKNLILGALTGSYEDERNLSGEEKFKRFELAVRVNRGGDVELKPEEIALIKKLVGKNFSVLVVGKIYQYLDS